MNGVIIGIDIGTSSCKTVAFDCQGNVLCSAQKSYPIYRGKNGEAEQDAFDYINAVYDAVLLMREKNSDVIDRTVAIGLTGQSPTEALFGKNGEPLCRMITWSDVRADAEAKRIASDYSDEKLFSMLDNKVPVSASWTASRLLWLSENRPETVRDCFRYAQAKDYVGYCLTGEFNSDIWSMKAVLNLKTARYCEDYLGYLGFGAAQMPDVLGWTGIKGHLLPEPARRMGMKPGIVVSVGCGDALATMLGSGAFEKEGIAFNSAGTSEIVGVAVGSTVFSNDVMTIPSQVTDSLTIRYGPTQSGSSSLIWLVQKVLNNGNYDDNSFAEAVAEAGKVEPGCGGMFFLPYIAGERCPVWNSSARGCFGGIHIGCDSGHFSRAVMEGVGFSVRHVLEHCSDKKPSCLRISGGGSRHKLWCRIKSDICGLPVEMLECENASALGAAMTAAVAAGIYTDTSQATKGMVRVVDSIEPDTANRGVYDNIYENYLAASARELP